jgi:putative ABC transport system permease protein
VALKGENIKGSNQSIRKGLVVFQFAISLFLMISTYVVFKQVNYMSNRNLGLDAQQVFIISDGLKVSKNYNSFKNQLLSDIRVQQVGMASSYPSSMLSDWNYQTVGENETQVNPYNIFVSSEIADVWGLTLVSGRFFEPDRVSDTASIVVNEQLVKELGWKEPLDQVLTRGDNEYFRVIGVIKNFAVGSAKRTQWPVLLRYQQPEKIGHEFGGAYIAAKINGDYRESYMHIEATWNDFVPGYPMDGIFMDDSFERLYESEKRFGMLFSTFSTVAIVIACIGLFALVAFTLERKRKEIALRKVMGAHVSHLYLMFCGQFARLMTLGALIALPVVYYLGNNWLEAYVDRISIGPIALIAPLILLITIAIATISYQVYQSTMSNPVNALKEE